MINEYQRLPCADIIKKHNYMINNESILDLINIFSCVFIEDISVTQKVNGRELRITIPVCFQNLEYWKQNKDIVVSLLNFVTAGDNDKWFVNFVGINYNINKTLSEKEYQNVTLLSGGLDSFCGAYINEINGINTVYCSYKTSPYDTNFISKVTKFILDRNTSSESCIFERVDIVKITSTQRTRSLLFLSLACLVADYYSSSIINIYENGIMTLNPTFDTRGTTRSTHPRTIFYFQKLIQGLQINIKIINPFLFLTKGSVINSLNNDYKLFIKNTHSCSRSQQNISYKKQNIGGCAACVPCILRMISLAAYDLEMFDHQYFFNYYENLLDNDRRSAIMYYRKFFEYINTNDILPRLDIRKKYYEDGTYLEKTEILLQNFRNECEIYFRKLGYKNGV